MKKILILFGLIFAVGITQALSFGEITESPKTHSDMFESPLTHSYESKLEGQQIARPHGDMIESPKKQMEEGVAAQDVICKLGFDLMIRYSGSAACVSSETAEKLESRGWGRIL